MSTAPRSPLHLSVSCLGPVTKIDGTLSKNAQNMIYARNGTGKSFLTRAFRYLDLHSQGQDISDAAVNLVSEESPNNQGTFLFQQGQTNLGTLNLNQNTNQVHADTHNRLFHVFSDDFVHTELRQRNYDIDGNIESEIRLDQTNIDTRDTEDLLEAKQKELSKSRLILQDLLESQKREELNNKASVNKRLKECLDIGLESVLRYREQPSVSKRSFKDVLSDLDALKMIPAEPEYPNNVSSINLDLARLNEIDSSLIKITSPSTVSQDIKEKIAGNPDFFETGLSVLRASGDRDCPFCEQLVTHPPASDRIEQYIAYFADAEGKHKKELRVAWSEIKSCFSAVDACATSVARESSKFEQLRKLVPSQRDVIIPDVTGTVQEIKNALEEYQNCIEAKGKSPSEKIAVPTSKIGPLVSSLNSQIELLNSSFISINKSVRASDNERRNLQREACQVFEHEFIHAKWPSISAMHELHSEIFKIKADLDEQRKSLLSDSVKARVAQTFDLLIGSFFGKKYTFDRDEFVLKRENKKMIRGASRTLSDGEKTAIAFCYFIACAHKKVKSTSDYAKIFFVFDDPITSMSYDFVFAIAQTLKNISVSENGEISINPAHIAKANRPDLLIFTHSSYFYNICVTNNVVKDEAAFFLHQAGNEHRISKRARYIAPFEQHLKEVVDVHDGREPDHTTGNAIRCVLEAIGRFCHPDKCDSLSNFIIYLAGEGGFEIKSVLINNLSHGTYYDEIPSPDELREACGEAIAIVDKYARGQLEMLRVLSSTSKQQSSQVAA